MKQYRDLGIVSVLLFTLNLILAYFGKISIYDFIMYLTVIAYCDFVVAIYVQYRFGTAEVMGKMVDDVGDLLKKLSKKKGKKKRAKQALALIEEAKQEMKDNV